MTYVPVRDERGAVVGTADRAGRVLFDVRGLSDEEPAAAPPAEEPAAAVPPPPRPVPPVGVTPFGSLIGGKAAKAPPPAKTQRQQIAEWAAIGFVAILAVLAALAFWPRGATSTAADTPAPPAATADAAAAQPTAADAPPAGALPLPLAAVAYDAPGGNPIDALEPGRPCAPVQRPNLDWVQLECAAAGLVWVRAEKLAGLEDRLPPIPTPEPTAVPPPTAVPQRPVYQAPVYQPPPQPAQLECADLVVDGVNYGQACAPTRAELLATAEAHALTVPAP